MLASESISFSLETVHDLTIIGGPDALILYILGIQS